MDGLTLRKLFGAEEPDKVIEAKRERAGSGSPVLRAARPRVTKVRLKPDECAALCKSIGLEYLEGYESRVLQYTLTDETSDRYGDVVVAKGGDVRNYMSQPVVLAFHNGQSFPVGNIIKIWLDESKNEWRGWVLFFDDRLDRSLDQIAETAFRYAASGAMKAGSIGFIPGENSVRRPDEEERKMRKMPKYGIVYDKWELLEFSLTPIPANPNATQRSVELFTRDGVAGLVDNDEIVFDFDVEGMLGVLREIEEAKAPPLVPVVGELLTAEPIKVDLGFDAEVLTMLINKMGILCDRVTALTKSVDTLLSTRTVKDTGCTCAEDLPDDTVDIDAIVQAARSATAKLRIVNA